MYKVSVSSGNGGGVFLLYADRKRVQHEIRNLPEGWKINIWEVTDEDNPRRCKIDEFVKAA